MRSDAAGPPDDPRPDDPRLDEPQGAFVERRTYRRRRLMDAARLLPILGALMLAVPLLWPNPDPYPAPGSHGGMPLSSAIAYIFMVWGGLICASFLFGLAVQRWAGHWTKGASGEEGRK